MAEESVRWFDLSRFGAALCVAPKSPLRATALMCLEIRRRDVFERMFGMPDREAGTDPDVLAERRSVKARFDAALRDLGFGEQPHSVVAFVGDDMLRYTRFFSARAHFTVADLQRLCPGLSEDDVRDMPRSEVRLPVGSGTDPNRGDWLASNRAAWMSLCDEVLAKEMKGLWTPKVSPFAKPYAQLRRIAEVNPESQRKPFGLLGRNAVAKNPDRIVDQLDRAGYREDALVALYADLPSALADGFDRESLVQVDAPYAAILWVTQGGMMIALKDVRHAPEVMGEDTPGRQYRPGDGGLLVSAMREAAGVAQALGPDVRRIKGWASDLDSLPSPVAFWQVVGQLSTAIEGTRRRFKFLLPRDLDYMRDPGVPRYIEDGVSYVPTPVVMHKALEQFTPDDGSQLARAIGRFMGLSLGDVKVLAGEIDAVRQRSHEMLQDEARAAAQRDLDAATKAVREAASDPDAHVRHVDAGEKIGGARKDFALRALDVDDLSSMNDVERQAFVVKKNVWGPLDYAAMRENGVQAKAAIAIKVLKDSIALEPNPDHHHAGEEPDAQYIRAVARVRDAMSEVKTLDEFAQACFDLYHMGKEGTDYTYGGSPFQVAMGDKACDILADSSLRKWGEEDPHVEVPRKVRNEIAKRERRYGSLSRTFTREATEDDFWRSLIKVRREKTDAEKADALEKARVDRELHVPHLEAVVREGKDWRCGRDIVADDLMDHFGFRAVEFGNWLPQDERQQVLNMAFDSFCDLAEALAIPPKAISFGDELAIAFGSRGTGGKHAALAHFEPARFVINLTRMKGAGSLAHEWMHALDWHLADKRGFASDGASGPNAAMRRIVKDMTVARGDDAVLLQEALATVDRGVSNAVSWLYAQGPDVRARATTMLSEAVGRLKDDWVTLSVGHLEHVWSMDAQGNRVQVDPDGFVPLAERAHVVGDLLKDMRECCVSRPGFTKVKSKVESNLHWMVNHLSKVCLILGARKLGMTLPESFFSFENSRDTKYLEEAKKLDKTRSEAYWATRRELFARAGAAFVLDELARHGSRSDYLVYGADEDRYKNHPVGNPNPTGDDRRLLCVDFGALMAEYRLACVAAQDAGMDASPLLSA